MEDQFIREPDGFTLIGGSRGSSLESPKRSLC